MWTCADCGRSGKAGNIIRWYEEKTPLAITYEKYCFDCFLKRKAKNKKRPHVHIRDRIST